MMTLHIRQAAVQDATLACEVVRSSIVELCQDDHHNDPQFLAGWLGNKTPGDVAAWIANPDGFVYIAECNDRIAGVAAMNRDGTITLMYVSPDMRFRGVSKALLAQLECKARELSLVECRLESTKMALNFYRAAGYREQLSSPRLNSRPAAGTGIPMVKRLVS